MTIAEYDDLPTIEERIGVSHSRGRINAPIIALGMVSVTERDADTLYRLKWALDSKEYRNGVKAVFLIVRALSFRHSWGWSLIDSEIAAEEVLRWWFCPICAFCEGRGANPVEGTPILDEGCAECHGSGRRTYPWIGNDNEKRYSLILYALQDVEQRVGGLIRDKLIDRVANQILDAGLLK